MPTTTRSTTRLAVLGLVLALLAAAGPAAARTLKIATVVPDGSSWLVEMRKAADEIKERTEGRVKLKFYPGGVMGSDKTVLRKVRAGQLQGGAFTSGALAALAPDIEIYSMPLVFDDYDEVDYVRERLDPVLKERLAERGFVALAITDGGFAHLLSRTPVRQVGDLDGQKVWIVEDDLMSQTALELAGVAPVPLPIADVYTALQTGLVDTVAAPPAAAIAFQWHTKVKYFTDVPPMYLVGVMAVDKRSFSKLSPVDQAVVREVVEEAGRTLDVEGRKGERNAREALQKQGIEFVAARSEKEVERWRQISRKTLEKLRAEDRYDNALLDRMLALIEEAGGNAPAPASGAE